MSRQYIYVWKAKKTLPLHLPHSRNTGQCGNLERMSRQVINKSLCDQQCPLCPQLLLKLSGEASASGWSPAVQALMGAPFWPSPRAKGQSSQSFHLGPGGYKECWPTCQEWKWGSCFGTGPTAGPGMSGLSRAVLGAHPWYRGHCLLWQRSGVWTTL